MNAEIRGLVERTVAWSPGALAVLAELRAEWAAAVEAEACDVTSSW